MFRKYFIFPLILILLLPACFPVGQFHVDIETAVPTQEETEPITIPEVNTPTDTPEVIVTEEPAPASRGTVSGKVCYPSEFIPAMDAYFRNTQTGALTTLDIAENQSTYNLDLPEGTYEAFAYLKQGELGGSYSQAVACGLGVECLDHTLIPFEVHLGQSTTDIDICDWYASALVPANPKASVIAEPALSGLYFASLSTATVWRVNADGQATPILAHGGMDTIVSPDGTQALFFQNDDVWLGDLTTGTWRNLTNTPDRVEYPAFWVPNTNMVGVSSHNPTEDIGLPAWQLTLVRLDGSSYEVVDDGAMWGNPAASPDGTLVAYDVNGEGRLYRIGSGVSGFDPAQYGLTGVERISAPAFSPDGTKLAWWVNGPLNGGIQQTALAVFDLSAGSMVLLHPYTPISAEGYSNPVWSPDGQWIASNVIGEESRSALWVFKADGSEEHMLGDGTAPVWGPANNALLFVTWGNSPAYLGALNRVMVGVWDILPSPLPPGSFPLTWIGQ